MNIDVNELEVMEDIASLAVVTGEKKEKYLLWQLEISMAHAKRIDLIVSFLMESGVKMFLPQLKQAQKRGVPIRILTGNYLGITQPSALYLLRSELGDQIDLRFYADSHRSFHPKAYFFHADKESRVFIGSSNISRSALTSGIEWNSEYNGGKSLIHWLSDFEINPFDDNEGWFNTGTGVFVSHNLKQKDCFFTDWCDGIEETVHLNVYSLPSGPVKVLDIVGDLGGFAFEDIARPCENSFADENGNRYITCINADFQDENPAHIVVTPRGNWTGKTKGGLILSEDYGKHFTRATMPYGLSEKLDETLAQIETPNVNSGWVAMSADGKRIVWSIAKGIELPISQVIVSHDGAKSFSRCEVYDAAGQRLDHTDEADKRRMKVVADRTDSSVFYGFGEHSRIYISRDAGQHFYECAQTKEWLTDVEFGLIDCANKTQIQAESGKRGVLYLAIGEAGLWRMQVKETNESNELNESNALGLYPVFTRLSAPGDAVYRLGLGVGKDGDYRNGKKVLYCNACIAGTYGFYRMFLDEQGQINQIERLNTENQMYGEINAMAGDCREYGTFYLATGSNGLIVGKQAKEE